MGFQKKRQTVLLISFVTILLFSVKPASTDSKAEEFIKKSCKTSMYPDLCYAYLAPFAGQVQQSPEKLALVSITFCLSKVKPLKSHIEDLCKKVTEPNLLYHLKRCAESFDTAVDSIKESIDQFKDIGAPGAISNMQTYMGAAGTCEEDCKDFMNEAPDGPEKKDVFNQTNMVEKINDISYHMINLFAHS